MTPNDKAIIQLFALLCHFYHTVVMSVNHSIHPFWQGIQYFITGMRSITKKSLFAYIIWPLIINILLFAGLLWLNIHYFHILMLKIDNWLPSWLHWLDWLLWILFGSLYIVFMSYTFTFFANLIGAPFNGFLSEKYERIILTNSSIENMGLKDFIKDIPRMLKRQWRFIMYYIPKAILCLILFFVPIIHMAAGVIWFGFNAWMMTIQYLDYPMDNHKIDFYQMRIMLAERRALSMGFGCAVMLCSMIPILNFVVMPAAVLGATQLYCDHFLLSSTAIPNNNS